MLDRGGFSLLFSVCAKRRNNMQRSIRYSRHPAEVLSHAEAASRRVSALTQNLKLEVDGRSCAWAEAGIAEGGLPAALGKQ